MGVAIGAHDPPSAGVGDPVKLARARIRIVPKRLGDGFEKIFCEASDRMALPRCAAFVGIAALWENWKTPRTARIHDRMPAIPRGHLTMSGGSALTPIRTTSLTPSRTT
jgi:hypothetical protein